MLALQKQAREAQAAAPVDSGLSVEQIRLRYAISGDAPSWMDGRCTPLTTGRKSTSTSSSRAVSRRASCRRCS
jgi:hypothetical protein